MPGVGLAMDVLALAAEAPISGRRRLALAAVAHTPGAREVAQAAGPPARRHELTLAALPRARRHCLTLAAVPAQSAADSAWWRQAEGVCSQHP